jgi:hypothetical protein
MRTVVFRIMKGRNVVHEDDRLGNYEISNSLMHRFIQLGGREAGYHTDVKFKKMASTRSTG